MSDGLPWRGDADSPDRPTCIPLPPAPMARVRGGRPLKRWRWVGVFDERVLLCAALARVAGLAQAWWAVWDRDDGRLHEGAHRLRTRPVALDPGRVRVRDGAAAFDLALDEGPGVETACPHGAQYVWTRKQAGVPARGTVRLGDRTLAVDGRAVIDDTAGYHARETAWRWCAGVGTLRDGRAVGWNLVEGVNDPPQRSERTVWVEGAAHEAGPVAIAAALDAVRFADGAQLRFAREATRAHRERLLLVRSEYVQPFGTFSGALGDGLELAAGLGVMESHAARW